MLNFFAAIFGYVLNLIYAIVGNYGLAIILFTILIKLVMLPISIKQQRTMKKNAEVQEEMKVIQVKYKNNEQLMNQEVMKLYKEKKISPFGGCLTTILQFILILSVFYMVRSPLTYMEKIPTESINNYIGQLSEEQQVNARAYPEIDLIRNSEKLVEKNPEDENVKKIAELKQKMNFLGLDLSKIPQQNMTDYTVYIIPVLYILSTFVSMKLTIKMQEDLQSKKDDKKQVIDITDKKDSKNSEEEKKENEEEDPLEAMMRTNKMMSWMMPILSVSIALVAPLGLALYWLTSNISMIIERLIINKVMEIEEEK